MLRKLAFAAGSSLLVTVVACGGADPSISDFNKGTGARGTEDGSGTGDGPGTGTIGGKGGTAENGDLAACATQSATAEARPVYLVFMFDKSGSMVQNNSPKWSSSKAATKAFFESAQSKGISASLTFFPDDADASCNVGDYATPRVAMSALPSATFGQQLDAQSPEGGTPTRPALEGAITYAQQVAAGQGKDGKVAVVLVTDGIPQGCNNNSINDVKTLASSVATNIPTYVIGVGNELGSLNDIAVGGGTKSALIVNVNNPAQIQADFTKAIEQIKASALTCDYKIPAPPSGETFDRSKVNVQHITGGATDTLSYNQACTNGTGWRYDDANAPTRILLCDGSCDTVKAKAGKVDILFGCATQTGPVK